MNAKNKPILLSPAIAFAAFTLIFCGGGEKKDIPQVPVSEFEEIRRGFDDQGILSAVGVGESSSEAVARQIAADNARAELALAVESRNRQNGNEQAASVPLYGTSVYRNITQYNAETGVFRVFSLVTSGDASLTTDSAMKAAGDEMMAKLDSAVAEYNAKNRR